ncbi:hypothetical protein PIB30_039857 [Stylosanthes scabra]|uniref:Uncharacterized protein n=1 Tax=Stylosanthes scabra TaxID=79078 RepID=A0ABU6UE77_9FABA|nr:hypothetical protein [Stylosanthes scabra]
MKMHSNCAITSPKSRATHNPSDPQPTNPITTAALPTTPKPYPAVPLPSPVAEDRVVSASPSREHPPVTVASLVLSRPVTVLASVLCRSPSPRRLPPSPSAEVPPSTVQRFQLPLRLPSLSLCVVPLLLRHSATVVFLPSTIVNFPTSRITQLKASPSPPLQSISFFLPSSPLQHVYVNSQELVAAKGGFQDLDL